MESEAVVAPAAAPSIAEMSADPATSVSLPDACQPQHRMAAASPAQASPAEALRKVLPTSAASPASRRAAPLRTRPKTHKLLNRRPAIRRQDTYQAAALPMPALPWRTRQVEHYLHL